MESDTWEKVKLDLKEQALLYVESLDRDKRIMGYRYVIKMLEHPKDESEMGFLQFLDKAFDEKWRVTVGDTDGR